MRQPIHSRHHSVCSDKIFSSSPKFLETRASWHLSPWPKVHPILAPSENCAFLNWSYVWNAVMMIEVRRLPVTKQECCTPAVLKKTLSGLVCSIGTHVTLSYREHIYENSLSNVSHCRRNTLRHEFCFWQMVWSASLMVAAVAMVEMVKAHVAKTFPDSAPLWNTSKPSSDCQGAFSHLYTELHEKTSCWARLNLTEQWKSILKMENCWTKEKI